MPQDINKFLDQVGYVPHQTAMEVMGWGMVVLALIAVYFLFFRK